MWIDSIQVDKTVLVVLIPHCFTPTRSGYTDGFLKCVRVCVALRNVPENSPRLRRSVISRVGIATFQSRDSSSINLGRGEVWNTVCPIPLDTQQTATNLNTYHGANRLVSIQLRVSRVKWRLYKTGIGLTTGFIGSHTVTHNYSATLLQLTTVHYNTCRVFTLYRHWLPVFQYRRIRSPATLQLFSEDCYSAQILIRNSTEL
jgi:hypothetical protein